jgi:phage repressor protein C with HTH and peptisase S24 domain
MGKTIQFRGHRQTTAPRNFKGVKSDVICGKLNGDGFKSVNIFHGDYMIVAKNEEGQHGDLVCVRLRGLEPVLKFLFYEDDGRIRVEDAPPKLDTAIYESADVEIIGRVIRIERDIPSGAGPPHQSSSHLT